MCSVDIRNSANQAVYPGDLAGRFGAVQHPPACVPVLRDGPVEPDFRRFQRLQACQVCDAALNAIPCPLPCVCGRFSEDSVTTTATQVQPPATVNTVPLGKAMSNMQLLISKGT